MSKNIIPKKIASFQNFKNKIADLLAEQRKAEIIFEEANLKTISDKNFNSKKLILEEKLKKKFMKK